MIHPRHPEWTPQAAAKTEAIIKHTKISPLVNLIDQVLYWVLLFIAIIGNFILSVVLVPFLLLFEGPALYTLLFFIGLSFGFVFNFILHSIDQLKTPQHIIAQIFIPAIAIINVGIMAMLSNKLIGLMDLGTALHSAALVGGCYVFGYVFPSLLGHFIKRPKLLR